MKSKQEDLLQCKSKLTYSLLILIVSRLFPDVIKVISKQSKRKSYNQKFINLTKDRRFKVFSLLIILCVSYLWTVTAKAESLKEAVAYSKKKSYKENQNNNFYKTPINQSPNTQLITDKTLVNSSYKIANSSNKFLTTSTDKLNCPTNYKEVSFDWATSDTANDGLVWSNATENKYNVDGNLVTATLEKNGSTSSIENGSIFLGAFPPPGGGLSWFMNTPDNTNTNNARFTIKFAYPVPVSEFVIADIDAAGSNDTIDWHDQVKVSTLGPTNPTVTLVPDNPSVITVSPSGDTAFAADGVGKVNNGTTGGNLTTRITGLIDTIIVDYQDGSRSQTDPSQHGIGIGSFSACYPKVDYGDAPDTSENTGSGNYQTLATDDGPSHLINSNLQIGTAPDDDNGTLQNIDADADDTTDTNDEQEITFTTLNSNSQNYSIEDIPVTNNTGKDAYLVGWIDFDGNGSFDSDEAATIQINSQSGTQNIDLDWSSIPNDIKSGTTYARFRLTTDTSIATGNAATSVSTGVADDGEVEDYKIEITQIVAANPNVILVKRITKLNTLDYIDIVDGVDNGDTQSSNYVPQPKDTEDNNLNWISDFLKGEISGIKVQPNDELEYTIYYLSTGDTEAKSVLLCDRVPANISFIPNSFNNQAPAPEGLSTADRGILLLKDGNEQSLTNVSDGDIAEYFPPGVEPTSVYSQIECGGTNTNGAIVVNLGNLPNATAPGTPNSSYGFVRFRGKVN